MPLARVLDFARREPDLRAPRQVAFALRPLLTLALSTAGLCREQQAAAEPGTGGAAAGPGREGVPGGRKTVRPVASDGGSELLFTALSSLIEVVRNLTPAGGRIYAQLGHEPLPEGERSAGPHAARAPRSEVVIELTGDANGAGERPLTATASGALAFELSVVAAIIESKGGQLSWHADGGPSRSFVVRLPVLRT